MGRNSGNKKVFIMGLGSLRMPVLEKFLSEGILPNFSRLLREGSIVKRILNHYPQKTHTGWVTIGTGASPGKHRVIAWFYPEGRAADEKIMTKPAMEYCEAEALWESAEKQGKGVILVSWPDSWPAHIKKGIQIGGGGLGVNGAFVSGIVKGGAESGPDYIFSLCADDSLELAYETKAKGQEAGLMIPLNYICASKPIISPTSIPARLDLETCSMEIQCGGKWTRVREGEWSANLEMAFNTGGNEVITGLFKIKLDRILREKPAVRLYRSAICGLHEWESPDGILEELYKGNNRIPFPATVFLKRFKLWKEDFKTQLEYMDMMNEWQADACRYLIENKSWDLFMTECTTLDWAGHMMVNCNGKRDDLDYLRHAYRSVDFMLGGICKALPEDASLVLLSEHGFKVGNMLKHVDVSAILEKAGLLARHGDGAIDWDNTVVYPTRGFLRYVKKEFDTAENVRRVVQALMSYKQDGGPVFQSVLGWKDAKELGFFGEAAYDFIYYLYPEYSGCHDNTLSAGEGLDSLEGFLFVKGAGIRKGYEALEKNSLLQIAPTVAKLMGIEPPMHCEESAIGEIFE